MKEIFGKFPLDDSLLSKMREGLNQFIAVRWDESWNQNAFPCFRKAPRPSKSRLYTVSGIVASIFTIFIVKSVFI